MTTTVILSQVLRRKDSIIIPSTIIPIIIIYIYIYIINHKSCVYHEVWFNLMLRTLN